jgi:predicted helicase
MSQPAHVKANHKAIQTYYQTLKDYREHDVGHETALRSAFQNLLAEIAKTRHWLLVPEQSNRSGGKRVVPDGTLIDDHYLHRGYWEAKDTDDKLDEEIAKKIKKGYPLSNIIFEDTRQAVLFQGKREALRVDLTHPQNLADLLNLFFDYTEPEIEDFAKAVEEFKDRVPDLARGLADKIKIAHRDNLRFQAAFASFFALCQTALNPNISQAAVDEMLVQHLLTERLFRKIFDNPEFTRRNVIAAEVETVIDALVSKSFNRDDFQKSLDRFYVAIENAAHTMPEFSDKQHFLNTVYERFFQGYSVKTADTHGIVYTPQAIVDFMCASVAEVLQSEFGKSLGDAGVNILDPCTGTGNFIVNLLRRIPKRDLPRMYRQQLFANEVMLLPYYIAALNIEHAYYELTGEYEPFEGLCFVDTLELAEDEQKHFSFMTEVNTARVQRQKRTPITVIIGNPPYNVGQLSENDNNKNRKYAVIEKRIRETYSKDSAATNKNALSDAYVKFFRWAVDRLEGREGIVCLVTNNSFVDQIAFDAMRKHLLQDFTLLYHLHLEGNVRHNPKLAGTTYNVFGIQVGVGITIAVRSRREAEHCLYFHRIDKNLRREEKLTWLAQRGTLSGIEWKRLQPDKRQTWIVPENADQFAAFLLIGSKDSKSAKSQSEETIFKLYGRGVATCRDDIVYDFKRDELTSRIQVFVDDYNTEVDRYKRSPAEVNVDDFVKYEKIKWSRDLKLDLQRGNYAVFDEGKIRKCLYRPFCERWLFFDRILNEEVYVFPRISPSPATESDNRLIALTDLGSEKPFMLLISKSITDMHLVGAGASCQCFPFYIYDEDAATAARTSLSGRCNSSASTTATRKSTNGTSSTTSTACCTIPAIAPSSPTISNANCRAFRSHRTSAPSRRRARSWPGCTWTTKNWSRIR